eukprot:PhM_4_TR4473/c0_g1_i1/m.87450
MEDISYLTASEAAAVDAALMGEQGQYTLEQLMELAGLSVATAIQQEYPADDMNRVLVVCGPGNNGGDGLVAARHLAQWGSSVDAWYPKPTVERQPHFGRLVHQANDSGVVFLKDCDAKQVEGYNVIVDAVFGFSFTGDVRAPFDRVLDLMAKATAPKVVSVDIPSGWHVENGCGSGVGLNPAMLVSLTAPKLCARGFQGVHYVGGRFISAAFAKAFNLKIPTYAGSSQVVRLPRGAM